MELESFKYNLKDFKGRNRRLLHEWQRIESRFAKNSEIEVVRDKVNAAGLPIAYWVKFHINCIYGVTDIERLGESGISNTPLFDNFYIMKISIPENFPDIDAQPKYKFENLSPDGVYRNIPWHPNIRFFGNMKGLVCLNRNDTFNDIADNISRIADYLRYKLYHAELTPPFPEDLKVAQWVREQGEPNEWLIEREPSKRFID